MTVLKAMYIVIAVLKVMKVHVYAICIYTYILFPHSCNTALAQVFVNMRSK